MQWNQTHCLLSVTCIYGLLTKLVRSRWLDIGHALFSRVYGPRRSRGILNTQEKELGQYPAILTEQISIFIVWDKTPKTLSLILRDQARNPEWAVQLHLARSGSQSQRGIWFNLPAHGASHIIMYCIVLYCT